MDAVTWDPLGTIGNVRWIGGGQWAGKTTVAGILARRYGLTVYRHADRLEWALDDLRALESPHPVIAEGWGLRPGLVAGIGGAGRMVVLVPTEKFRQHRIATLPRARRLGNQVSDPEPGQRNRVDRDRLIAEDAAQSAARHAVPVIEVDGSRDADGVADLAAGPLGLA